MTTIRKSNSFDLLRLAGALAVLISHAFAVTGRPAPEIGGVAIHTLGVCVFFAISGFLITSSWKADAHVVRFLRRRVLRIVPALSVTAVATALIIGPVFSREPAASYFLHPWVFRYAISNSLLLTVWSLPGLFEQLPLKGQANGSLWTLPIEFSLYLIVPFLTFVTRRVPLIGAVSIMVLAVLTCATVPNFPKLANFAVLGINIGWGLGLAPFFWCGAALRMIDFENLPALHKRAPVALSLVALIAWAITPGLTKNPLALAVVPMSIIVIATGLSPVLHLKVLDRIGDLSYGTYLWAFPIQQGVAQVTGSGPFLNTVITLPIVLFLAFASWRTVEKPAMRFRPIVRPANMVLSSTTPLAEARSPGR